MTSLPNDIIRKIISYLDIDTRRSFGIYNKLVIPIHTKNNLDFMLNRFKIKVITDPYFPKLNISILDLNSLYIIKHQCYSHNLPDYTVIHYDYLYGREHMWLC